MLIIVIKSFKVVYENLTTKILFAFENPTKSDDQNSLSMHIKYKKLYEKISNSMNDER